MGQKEKQDSSESLDKEILNWRVWLTGFGAALIGAYFIYFGLLLKQNPAEDAGTWADFGSFFGGILGPLVAFAAFYWLTQSVKIQKTELAETRKALEISAKAQQEQVENGNRNVHIAALTAVVNAGQSQIYAIEKEIKLIDESIELINQNINFSNLNLSAMRFHNDFGKMKKEYEENKITGDNDIFNLTGNRAIQQHKLKLLIKECESCLEVLRRMIDI